MDRDPGIWVILTLLVVYFFACLYVAAKEFRGTMHHPPQKRDGKLYRIALGIVVTGSFLIAVIAGCFTVSTTRL